MRELYSIPRNLTLDSRGQGLLGYGLTFRFSGICGVSLFIFNLDLLNIELKSF